MGREFKSYWDLEDKCEELIKHYIDVIADPNIEKETLDLAKEAVLGEVHAIKYAYSEHKCRHC